MIVLPDRADALRIAAFLDEHTEWSAFWDRRYGVWRVSEDDPGSELYAEDADAGRVIDYMSARADDAYGDKAASAEREADAADAAARIDPRLITFALPAIPESVRIARFHVRAALGYCELGRFADDAAIITSELVTNAVQHARCDVTETVRITLARASGSEAVIIAMSDSSPHGPVMRTAPAGSERGLGLHIVESLSARWGWHPEPGGKAVFAILAGRTSA